MRMKYSLIMPYYDRISQLDYTLKSFQRYERDDFEVIIVEDKKANLKMHRDLVSIIGIHAMKIKGELKVISSSVGEYNPATAFNEGVAVAKGEFIILTSPEIYHETDILTGLDYEFTKSSEVYVICACMAINAKGFYQQWYQHSEYRDARYHFCSALSAVNYLKIGGFDQDFTSGYGYDDDDFRDRVINVGIPFIIRDDLLTIHQFHNKVRPHDWRMRLNRNKQLYENKKRDRHA